MTDTTPTRRRRRIRAFAALIVLAVVAGLTLAPPSIAAPARRMFVQAMVAIAEPIVLWIPGGLTERTLNTLLFVPLGATVALLLRRRLWPLAIFAGFALSTTVEFAQTSIPGRVPDPSDVLWNTVGAAIGVALVAVPRLIAARTRRSPRYARTSHPAPSAPAPHPTRAGSAPHATPVGSTSHRLLAAPHPVPATRVSAAG